MIVRSAGSPWIGGRVVESAAIDGDGRYEIVDADHDDAFVFDGLTGLVLWRDVSYDSPTDVEVPLIVDADADGSAETVVRTASIAGSPREGLVAYGHPRGVWMGARHDWPLHDWNETIIHALRNGGGRLLSRSRFPQRCARPPRPLPLWYDPPWRFAMRPFHIVLLLVLTATTPALAKKKEAPPPPPPPPARMDGGLESLMRPVEGRFGRATSTDIEGDVNLAPGETLTLAEIGGPGVIDRLWIGIEGGDSFWREIVLRVTWDGASAPSVEVPIGDFFAVGPGARKDLQSAPFVVRNGGRSLTSYWKMPFQKGARVTLTNDGITATRQLAWEVDWRSLPTMPPDTMYFHAQYNQSITPELGKAIPVLRATGRGHLAGLALAVQNATPGAWGTGRVHMVVDEDPKSGPGEMTIMQWFGGLFGFRQEQGPVQGCTLDEGDRPKARTSLYRFHIDDPVPWSRSVSIEIDHGPKNDRVDRYALVAYSYQDRPSGPSTAMAPAAERRWASPTDAELAQWRRADELNDKVLDAYRRSALDDARRLLEELLKLEPDSVYVNYNLSCLYALAGKKDEALHMLEQAIKLGFTELGFARHDPDLASLRENERYKKLVGIP